MFPLSLAFCQGCSAARPEWDVVEGQTAKKRWKNQQLWECKSRIPGSTIKTVTELGCSDSVLMHYYEARNDYTNNSETILLCNRCVCNWKINSQRILLCNWHLQKVPHGSALITQKNSCQKALCNRCPVQLGNYFPNNKNVCVIILGPIVWT